MRAIVHPFVPACAAFLALGLIACPSPPEDDEAAAPAQSQVQVQDTALVRAEGEASVACEQRDRCVIVIALDGDGTLAYRERESGEDARVLRLRPDQSVEWETEDGSPWGVEFLRGRTPLPAASFGTRDGLDRGGQVGSNRGLFKYFVAVVRNGELFTDDPEFVI